MSPLQSPEFTGTQTATREESFRRDAAVPFQGLPRPKDPKELSSGIKRNETRGPEAESDQPVAFVSASGATTQVLTESALQTQLSWTLRRVAARELDTRGRICRRHRRCRHRTSRREATDGSWTPHHRDNEEARVQLAVWLEGSRPLRSEPTTIRIPQREACNQSQSDGVRCDACSGQETSKAFAQQRSSPCKNIQQALESTEAIASSGQFG